MPQGAGPAPIGRVAERLGRTFPDARTELDHDGPFELLVATVLSAQTTDARVNSVTPELFRRWPEPTALADADPEQVEQVLRPLGMGPTRAGRVIGLSRSLLAEDAGEVPDDQEALEALPGVGRKTAHVVRGIAFGRSLLAVDTHVTRLAGRLGWSASSQARTVERQVVALAEESGGSGDSADGGPAGSADGGIDLTRLSLRLILHGRRVCTARAPRCEDCVLADLCPRIGVVA